MYSIKELGFYNYIKNSQAATNTSDGQNNEDIIIQNNEYTVFIFIDSTNLLITPIIIIRAGKKVFVTIVWKVVNFNMLILLS